MKRTVMLQGVRRMKFESVPDHWEQRELSQAEAAEGTSQYLISRRHCSTRRLTRVAAPSPASPNRTRHSADLLLSGREAH